MRRMEYFCHQPHTLSVMESHEAGRAGAPAKDTKSSEVALRKLTTIPDHSKKLKVQIARSQSGRWVRDFFCFFALSDEITAQANREQAGSDTRLRS